MSAKPKSAFRILIADDCEDLRLLYTTSLRLAGWQTMEAKDGQEALEMILREQPDVVILDQNMPNLKGSDVYVQMRQHGVDTPVILVAAESDIAILARKVGIRHYLGKPTTPDDLRQLVAQVSGAAA